MSLPVTSCQCARADSGPSMAGSCGNSFLVFMTILQSYINTRCDIADSCNRVRAPKTILDEYDFVVIGGGAAGAVAAARLSENFQSTVLLLEAGGDEPLQSSVISFYTNYWDNPEVDWMYRTEPEAKACHNEAGSRCKFIRGKALGGCTVVNGLMYHRGHEADYENWVAGGAEGWSWAEVLPYFYKSENNTEIGTVVSAEHHAVGGPLTIQRFRYQPPLAHAILTGATQAGIPVTDDMNGADPVGLVIAQTANEDGLRLSTARAFLRPAAHRSNLHVLTHAMGTRITFNDDKVASGVEFFHEAQHKSVRVAKEVVLTAGALNSPQLLMLSGIGPRETLEKHNIPVVVDLPGVGQNLGNHVGVNMYFKLNQPATQDLDWAAAMEFMTQITGPLTATGITQVTGMVYSSVADVARAQPDLQFFFNGFYANCSRSGIIDEPINPDAPWEKKRISITGVNGLPRSVGHLTLNSSDPFDPPLFFPNYFHDPIDVLMLKDAAKIIYKLVNSDILKNTWGFQEDTDYTARCRGDSNSTELTDEFLECMIATYTDPQNHQVGTAKIGRANDTMAVVDSKLRVFGVEGLRVMDAAAIPIVPSGNPMAPVIMVAERGSDFVKEHWNITV